jgi:predicted PurR-regulated permease PerM
LKKVYRFFTFALRLTFLPLLERSTRRKWQAAFIVVSYLALMYAVFFVCIHPEETIFRQVNEMYGTERGVLDMELSRIHEIVFKNARRSNPNMITIVPTATLEAQRKQDSITAANALSPRDQLFLLEILTQKKDSSLSFKK